MAAWSRPPRRRSRSCSCRSLVKLDDARKRRSRTTSAAASSACGYFQLANGGFSYWPGGSGGFAAGYRIGYAVYASTYASHFLVEAEKRGFTVPQSMRAGMIRNLRSTAQEWRPAGQHARPGLPAVCARARGTAGSRRDEPAARDARAGCRGALGAGGRATSLPGCRMPRGSWPPVIRWPCAITGDRLHLRFFAARPCAGAAGTGAARPARQGRTAGARDLG